MSAAVEILILVLAVIAIVFLARDLAGARGGGEGDRTDRSAEPDDDADEPAAPGFVDLRLLRAGMPIGATSYLVLSGTLAIIVFLVAISWLPGSSWFLAAVVALLAVALPWIGLGAWARRRARLFEEKLVDGVDVMVSALSAGEGLEDALTSAADVASPPVGSELREISERLEVGMSMPRAVRRMALARDSEGVKLFTQTLVAQSTSGGELTPVLRSVARIMRDRLRMRLRLQSQLAGARLAAIIVAVLPYLLLPVFLWRRPEWLSRLFADPIGIKLLVVAILLQILGFVWLRRVMRIEVNS